MTFDEAYVAAAELLVKREQLLNGHLLRLVDGDKALYSELRVALIRDGLAEDRPGAGLVHARMTVTAGAVEKGFRELSERPDPVVRRSDEASPADESSDWWLMVSGVIQGPFTYETLARMHRQGEIAPGDVVRQGTKGLWKRPSDVLRLPHVDLNALEARRSQMAAASRPGDPAHSDGSTGSARTPYLPPAKTWSNANQTRPSRLRQGWDLLAHLCGGSKRLSWGLVTLTSMGLFFVWWQQPPASETIYREFTDCYATLQKLRERRIGRSEWAPTVTRFRPRVQSILTRLQFRNRPEQKELYQAGTQGLVPLLDVPRDPTDAERVFEKHMRAARAILDHGQPSASPNVK